MGVVGFSSTVSKEGAKYNILCNTIAPQAFSRMTANVLPPGKIIAHIAHSHSVKEVEREDACNSRDLVHVVGALQVWRRI